MSNDETKPDRQVITIEITRYSDEFETWYTCNAGDVTALSKEAYGRRVVRALDREDAGESASTGRSLESALEALDLQALFLEGARYVG